MTEFDDCTHCIWCFNPIERRDEVPYCQLSCRIEAEAPVRFWRRVIGILPGLDRAWHQLKDERAKLNGCFRKDGSKKIGHETEELAIKHVRALVDRGLIRDLRRVKIYQCYHCRLWHVGHFGGA